jgi:hypothetical protein
MQSPTLATILLLIYFAVLFNSNGIVAIRRKHAKHAPINDDFDLALKVKRNVANSSTENYFSKFGFKFV